MYVPNLVVFNMIIARVPCPGKDWRRCEVGRQCISPENWCNFIDNCIDGSDEKNCSKLYLVQINQRVICVLNKKIFR